MAILTGVFVGATILLTLYCAYRHPRTIFGNLILLAGAFLIAENFAFEETPRKIVPIIVAVLFNLAFLAISVHAARRLARNAEAILWTRAGMSGAFLVWQSYTVTGKEARFHWLMRALLPVSLAMAMTAGFAGRLATIDRVRISDETRAIADLNTSSEGWESWPSPEIKALAGESAWGDWRPKQGDEGQQIWWMNPPKNSKYLSTIYVLELRDHTGTVHYVPMTSTGFDRVRQ